MLAYPIATVAILLMGQQGSHAASSPPKKKSPPNKIDFLRAMKNHSKRRKLSKDTEANFKRELYGSTKHSAALRKKLMEKSVVTKTPGSEEKSTAATKAKEAGGEVKKHIVGDDAAPAHRKLEDANNNNNNNNNYVQNKYNADYDGTDDWFAANQADWENEMGFDVTQYSASYAGCASVSQFDDEMAATEDTTSVFITKQFVVFRFCPEQTCMGWQQDYSGCGCDDQCDSVMEYEGYGNDDDDDDDAYQTQSNLCLSACQNACSIWGVQQDLSNGDFDNGDYDRKLEEDNNGNNNYANWNMNYKDQQNNNPYSQYAFEPYVNNQEEWGANGEGCQNNYGEYMIELQDYLQLQMEYDQERYEMYEEYCTECMQLVYKQWMNQWSRDRKGRKLSFDEFVESEEHRNLFSEYNVCPEYDTCKYYKKIEYIDDYSQWFECTEVERNNGQVAYVAPHCAEDGNTITLGVFSDEKCYNYIGNGVDISNFIGEELEEDALKSYYNSAFGPTLDQLQYVNEDQVCIPCNRQDLMWDTTMLNMNDDDAQQQNYEEDAEFEITQLCIDMYKESARCDMHYRTYKSKSKQAQYAEAVEGEKLTCGFIESVAQGSFGEDGFVHFDSNYKYSNEQAERGWMGDTMVGQQYNQAMSQVTPLQIFGLIASLLACICLLVWSATLNKSLSKTGSPWRPRRGGAAALAGETPDLNHNDSGVVMGRSQSNTSYYMT